MSFYGNIKRVDSSPYVFDKIYPNRAAMENNVNEDGVYIGRYVLVKYTCKYGDNNQLVYFDKYTTIYSTINLTSDTYEKDKYYIFSNEEYLLATEDFDEETQYYIAGKEASKDYKSNVKADISYNDTFDATVWQKIYTNVNSNKPEKYILIARLNGEAPTMALNPVKPKYLDSDGNEHWHTPSITLNSAGQEIYSLNINDVLKLEVGDTGENLINTDYLNPQYQTQISSTTASDGMYWVNYNGENEVTPDSTDKSIDTKKLEVNLQHLGKAISDFYDLMYGMPTNYLNNKGERPYFIDNEEKDQILNNLNNAGLVGILSSIGAVSVGDGSQDSNGTILKAGDYYYLAAKWTDALEDPHHFIENIPQVIGSTTANGGSAANSHYYIDFNATGNDFIKSWTNSNN